MKRTFVAVAAIAGVLLGGYGVAGGTSAAPTARLVPMAALVPATPAAPLVSHRPSAPVSVRYAQRVEVVAPIVEPAPVAEPAPSPELPAPVLLPEPVPVATCAGFRLDNDGYYLYWHADPNGGWRGPDGGTYTYSAAPVDGCGYTPCAFRSAPPPVAESDAAECPWPEDHTKIPQPAVP